MIGGFMINKIKEAFALTQSGAKGTFWASIACFGMNIAYMLPITALMFFIRDLLGEGIRPTIIYIGLLALIALLMYLLINTAYSTTYNETYKEAANLRIELAELLRELPLSFFSKHTLSDISQTIMKDVSDLEHAISHAVPELIGFILYFMIIAPLLLIGNVKMGLAIILPICLSLLLLILSKKIQIRETTKYFERLRKNSDLFQEAIEMQQEIKSYGKKDVFKKNIFKAIDESEKIHIRSEIAQALPTASSHSLVRFSLGCTVLTGAFLYQRGEVSLLFFLGYLIAAARIVDGIGAAYMNIAEIMYLDARIQRIKTLRNAKKQGGKSLELKNYDISFEEVEFSYNEESKIIDKISFTAKQNEVTALIGPSGCGKTTVLRLMSRLYDYDKGSIKIDGKDIMEIDTDTLFQNISIVFQEVVLFNTSIMENIRIGKRDASDEEVKRAARLACCEEFIEKMPEGYNTLVGENGMRLSGGERQRLSIARAILKDAPIILLDEISSSLDVENEMRIQESLNHLIRGKTVVIISHRLKSIERADKIVLFDKGRIDAIGTHEELAKSSALYRTMLERAGMIESYSYV